MCERACVHVCIRECDVCVYVCGLCVRDCMSASRPRRVYEYVHVCSMGERDSETVTSNLASPF